MSTCSTAPAAKRALVLAAVVLLSTAALHSACDTLRITFIGDVLLDRGVRNLIEEQGTAECLFSASVDSVFRASHLVVANLECPATKIEQPVFKRFIFRGEPEWLEVLKSHGVTHLNLANNHSVDQGRDGLLDTRDNILRCGMTPIGAGECMDEAVQPVLLHTVPRKVFVVPSLRLTLENYPYLPAKPCVSQESFAKLLQRVKALRQSEPQSCIVVCLHWGTEHRLTPSAQQTQQAHDLIDAGADCLICHHTHTLQSIENYRGKPIYYSIGNFIFDQSREINSKACMVQLTVTKQGITAKTIPVFIKKCVPQVIGE